MKLAAQTTFGLNVAECSRRCSQWVAKLVKVAEVAESVATKLAA